MPGDVLAMRVGLRSPAQKGLRSVKGSKFWGRCRWLAESVFKGGSAGESELIGSPGTDFTCSLLCQHGNC